MTIIEKLCKFAIKFMEKLASSDKENVANHAKNLKYKWLVVGDDYDWQSLDVWMDAQEEQYKNIKLPSGLIFNRKYKVITDLPILDIALNEDRLVKIVLVNLEDDQIMDRNNNIVPINNSNAYDLVEKNIERLFYMPKFVSGGEYQGTGLVGESNVEYFENNSKLQSQIKYWRGDYNSRGILISILNEDENILSTLDKLQNDYILDETSYNNLVQEMAQNQAEGRDGGINEFGWALEDHLNIEITIPFIEIDDGSFFWGKFHEVGGNLKEENGHFNFPIKEMAEATTIEELIDLAGTEYIIMPEIIEVEL